MRLLLKNGERVEGVPTKCDGTFEAPFGGVVVDPSPEDNSEHWPLTWTLTVGGRAILAQELAEFSLALAG
jgi:hypothetical protein